jgi:hypothetical protein
MGFTGEYVVSSIPSMQLVQCTDDIIDIHGSLILYAPYSEPFKHTVVLHRRDNQSTTLNLYHLQQCTNYIDSKMRASSSTVYRWNNLPRNTVSGFDDCSRDLILANYLKKTGKTVSVTNLDVLNKFILARLGVQLEPKSWAIPIQSSPMPVTRHTAKNVLADIDKRNSIISYLDSLALSVFSITSATSMSKIIKPDSDADNIVRLIQFANDKTYNRRFHADTLIHLDRFHELIDPKIFVAGQLPSITADVLSEYRGLRPTQYVPNVTDGTTSKCDVAMLYYPDIRTIDDDIVNVFNLLRLGGMLITVSFTGVTADDYLRGRLAYALLTTSSGDPESSDVVVPRLLAINNDDGYHFFRLHEARRQREAITVFTKTLA